jgi:phosphohistidine phosphatase
MKTVYILRHGKSSWSQSDVSDFDRELLITGKERTAKIAKLMLAKESIPELLICSPAKRAKQTAKIISKKLNKSIELNPRLYPGGIDQILNIIYSLSDNYKSVMIIGHNPGLTTAVNELMDSQYDWLPTSGLAIANYEVEKWTDIALVRPKEVKIFAPKEL